jgi:hypothetical protein
MGERGGSAGNHMPPGLHAMEIQGDGWSVALAIRGANKRFNRICGLQLPTAQLGLSFLEFRNADYGNCRRDYLYFKSQGSGKIDPS